MSDSYYSIIVSRSAHFAPGGKNWGSKTDCIMSNSHYSESRYEEVRLYVVVKANRTGP